MPISYRLLQDITLGVAIGGLLVAQSAFVCGKGEPMPDPQELKVRRFLDRIKADQQARNVAELQSINHDIEKEWATKKDAGYFRVMRELCNALNSTNPVDSSRADLIRKLATAALDAPEDKPIEQEVGLLLSLQADRDYIRGSLRGEGWLAERPIRVRRWLKVRLHLSEEKARWDKKIGGPAYVNIAPPPESGMPAGVSPEAIKDPAVRKKYEEAITRNSERVRINRKKRDLRDLEARFTASVKRYIVSTYTKPPYATDELEKLLTESRLDASTRAEILSDVKKSVTERMEREAKQPPPPHMQITEPAPPPDAPTYRADPRLRVKVSFDLKAPLVEDVLQELRLATKVNLSRADEIQNQYAAHGSLSIRNVPAWRVMDNLAKSKRVEGRWEKDGDGYRLVSNGNPVVIPEASEKRASGTSTGGVLLIAAAALLLSLSLAYWWIRRRRSRVSASS